MSELVILLACRALLVQGDAWLENRPFGAVDEFDRPCDPRSSLARRWGLLAAIRRVGGSDDDRIAAVDRLCRAAGVRWLPGWEEAVGRTPAEVAAALERAIAAAQDGGRP